MVDKDLFLYMANRQATEESAGGKVMVDQRVAAVCNHLQHLRSRYISAADLLTVCGVFVSKLAPAISIEDEAMMETIYSNLDPEAATRLLHLCNLPRCEPEIYTSSWICSVCQGGVRILSVKSPWLDDEICPLCGGSWLP